MTALTLGPQHKSFPQESWGLGVEEFLDSHPTMSDFQTPLVTIDRGATTHNVQTFARWAQSLNLEFAPHGKTSMSPQLWQQLLDAGAWGITLATVWQAQVARSRGFTRIQLAGELVDPVALRWLAAELAKDPDCEFMCWVDDLSTVDLMEAALAAVPSRVTVLVELGGAGGRSGARSIDEALEVARAVAASPVLTLAGVAGYEGSFAHDRSDAGLAAVAAFVDSLAMLHLVVADAVGYDVVTPIVTVGGSAYFDIVAERLAPLAMSARVMLRSGAVQFHDDGFYESVAPRLGDGGEGFRSALHGWSRVVSRPERGLAILDGGKRDFAFDNRMPMPQRVVGVAPGASAAILAGSQIDKINDQHAFLRLREHVASCDLPVGSVIKLGLSHPCLTFDKWRALPVIADSDVADPRVIDVVETCF